LVRHPPRGRTRARRRNRARKPCHRAPCVTAVAWIGLRPCPCAARTSVVVRSIVPSRARLRHVRGAKRRMTSVEKVLPERYEIARPPPALHDLAGGGRDGLRRQSA